MGAALVSRRFAFHGFLEDLLEFPRREICQLLAPFIQLLVDLDGRFLHFGVGFVRAASQQEVFTPRQPGDGKYADTLLQGIRLTVTDRAEYDAPATALRLLVAIRQVHPTLFAWIPAHFDRLAGQPGLREALDRGAPVDSILAVWAGQRTAFARRAAGVRLYPE